MVSRNDYKIITSLNRNFNRNSNRNFAFVFLILSLLYDILEREMIYLNKFCFFLKKVDKGPEQTLLHGGHTEGPQKYERMFSIASHQTDAN